MTKKPIFVYDSSPFLTMNSH